MGAWHDSKRTETVNDVGGELLYVKDVEGENVEGIRVCRVEDGSMNVDVNRRIDSQGYGIPHDHGCTVILSAES